MRSEPGGIFKPRRLGHVNFVVADLERSVAFYRDVCGLNLEFTESGLRAAFMGVGHTPHDVGMIEQTNEDRYGRDGHVQIPKGAVSAIGFNHVAWEMQSEADLVAAYQRALEQGVVSKRTLDHQIAHSVYLPDPDGNMNEFYADTIKDWRSVMQGDVELVTSTWTPGQEPPATDARWDSDPELRQVEHAMLHPARLSHVALQTQQLPQMIDFYTQVAGLTLIHQSASAALLCPTHTPSPYQLALVTGTGKGLHHYAFEIGDRINLDDRAQALRTDGHTVTEPVRGPLKDSLFTIDPDGFRVEFCHRRSDGFHSLAEVRDAAFLV